MLRDIESTRKRLSRHPRLCASSLVWTVALVIAVAAPYALLRRFDDFQGEVPNNAADNCFSNNVSVFRCVAHQLLQNCYNRGSDTCRWLPSGCGFSGAAVSPTVFRGRTICFRGDSTLRDLYSFWVSKSHLANSGFADERVVTKTETNWERRGMVYRSLPVGTEEGRMHLLFHFDYLGSHLKEFPLTFEQRHRWESSAPKESLAPRIAMDPAMWSYNASRHSYGAFREAVRAITGSERIDIAVFMLGIYEARWYAERNASESEYLAMLEKRDFVGSIIHGACTTLRSRYAIFYAPTLECRALRLSKGARRKGAAWCSRASLLLRSGNQFIRKALEKRAAEMHPSAVEKGASSGGCKERCPVYFIPAFLCHGNHQMCTIDGMHGRRTSHYIYSKAHLLMEAIRFIEHSRQLLEITHHSR